jgi:hypothetical protein
MKCDCDCDLVSRVRKWVVVGTGKTNQVQGEEDGDTKERDYRNEKRE